MIMGGLGLRIHITLLLPSWEKEREQMVHINTPMPFNTVKPYFRFHRIKSRVYFFVLPKLIGILSSLAQCFNLGISKWRLYD